MKKAFFLAAIAIGMAACTNVEDVVVPQDAQRIALKAVTNNPTRGAVEGAVLPQTTTMYVSAWQVDGSNYIKYLNNAAFIWNGSSAWTGGYYYPTSGSLQVQAFTCDEGADQKMPVATLNGDTGTEKITSLVLDFAGAKLEGKTDVMWSEIAFPTKNASGNYGSFNLPFYHSLAWIVVNFIKPGTSTADDNAILLRNVKLNGVRLSGKLTVTPDHSASPITYNPVWSERTDAENVSFPAYVPDPGAEGIPFGTAASKSALGLLIIPGDQTSISFDYCTKNGTDALSNPTYTDWITYTVDGLSGQWEAGKKYVYNISISTTEISITATVQGWQDGGTTDKTID